MYENNSSSMHRVASTHTSHIYTTMQTTQSHVHDKVNSLLRLLELQEVVPCLLCNPPFINYATQWSSTSFLVLRGRMNMLWSIGWGRHTVEKTWPFHTLSTTNRGQSDIVRGIQSWCAISAAFRSSHSLNPSFSWRGERGRDGANADIAVFHGSLTTWAMVCRRMQLVVINHFPVNCSLCESHLLGALDAI